MNSLKTYATPKLVDGIRFLKFDDGDRQFSDAIIDEALKAGKRIRVEIAIERGKHSQSQQAKYFVVLGLLFEAVNGHKARGNELLDFHEEFKFIHANRQPSTLRPGTLVPIRVRESDVYDMNTLIENVYLEMAQIGAETTFQIQNKARNEWFNFWLSGGPVPYKDDDDFRSRAVICAAYGCGGPIEKAHMESRGANHSRIDDPTNWLPLCTKHHREQHQIGVIRFLAKYPHLKPRWENRLERAEL